MSGKKIKKIPSLVWPGKIKTWWSFLLILSLFGSKKESLREWSRPGTLPSGPLRCFPSSDILTTVTKFWVAQKKDFLNIWGGPVLPYYTFLKILPSYSIGKKYGIPIRVQYLL